MNKKFLISVVAMFVMSLALGFVVHAVLLAEGYTATGMFRPEAEQMAYFPYMLLAHAFIAIGFVWIYLKGRENKPFLAQGVRFGLAVAILMTIPTYLIYYAVQPMPGMLVVEQIAYDAIGVVLMGVVVAWLNA